MKHFSHEHELVLNETYIAKKGDVCRGCNDPIVSCKSFVYSCGRSSSGSTSASKPQQRQHLISNYFKGTNLYDEILGSQYREGLLYDKCLGFLLHKTCAELPRFMDKKLLRGYAEFPEAPFIRDTDVLAAGSRPRGLNNSVTYKALQGRCMCAVCGKNWKWFSYCTLFGNIFFVCLKCAIFLFQSIVNTEFHHQAHTQHALVMINTLSSFNCHACKVEDDFKHLSYKCTVCQFWIHKSCGDAPASFLFRFHEKHPLDLTFCLPKVYHRFTQYCRLCYETLNRLDWLYYCRKCRFFVHFHCARSYRMLSSNEDNTYPNLVHLPATDESSLVEYFVEAMSTLENDNNIRNVATTNRIKDWAHDEHPLQLITISDLHDHKDVAEKLLLCNGCVKPIRTDGKLFYACVSCKYFLHKVCAELPREIEHHLWPGMQVAIKCSEADSFKCNICGFICNGIIFGDREADTKLHIGCALLPKLIKHDAHRHQLTHLHSYVPFYYDCRACGQRYDALKHGCKNCDFYVCGGCIMKARTIEHRWDPHPLRLIYDPSMVVDHEHDFNCELCSSDIDANYWFYHCSVCDLSFHMTCADDDVLTKGQFIDDHSHPLILSSWVPKVYRNSTVSCKICLHCLDKFEWILYCTQCSYFWHLDCATTPRDQNMRFLSVGFSGL